MLAAPTTPLPGTELTAGRELLRAGRVTDALRILEPGPLPADAPDAAATLAALLDCRLARGELGAAGMAGERLALHTDRGGVVGALAHHALGELATARGEHETAATRYADAGDRQRHRGDRIDDDPEVLPWRSGRALALTRLGRHREARDLAAEHLAVARAAGSSYAVAQALRTLATTSTDGGRMGLLRDARAALAPIVAERLAAQIDTDLAGLLILHGDGASRDEAVALLRGAEAYAGREELAPLQHRARGLLQRLGEPPRLVRREALATLTAAERKAARMASEGLTNREIAGQLRVTVKAVEWHLSHVYRKLGIRSRLMLADSLTDSVAETAAVPVCAPA